MSSDLSNQNVITLENVVYTYPKTSQPAVKNVSFNVKKGEIFGLLGPSGAGKSTIQKVLTRQFRNLTSGKVSLMGRPLAEWDHMFYEKIGVGFELPNHYLRLTGAENLKFFASLYQAETRDPIELLDLLGLKDAADKRVSDYSKGMMMRLNFARALLHNPEIFFFDEPTSGLDPVNAQNVKNIIRDLQKQGKTIVLTTHNMFDVEELCERCAFMLKGEMKILDHVDTLKAQYGEKSVSVSYEGKDGQPKTAIYPLEGLGHNSQFLDLIKESNVQTLHSQEATLDKVFVEVTGVTLDSESE